MGIISKVAIGLVVAGSIASAGTIQYRGVNLAGAEFAGSTIPGSEGTNYAWPTAAQASYYKGKGMNIIRLPFLWERLQPTQAGSFSTDYWNKLKTTVNGMTALGMNVILDPHNYARHNGEVIGAGVTNAEFADLWTKLATEFKSNSNVIFGLMNEPRDMVTETWFSGAQAAIDAIRATGASNLILVPGNAWTGAHSWYQQWYGTPNATVALTITDRGNNMAFEVHQYLDSDHSGTNSSCVSTTEGSKELAEFNQWLTKNNKKGFLGEFAGGNNSTCQAAINDMLTFMENNSSNWIGWTWWAGGPMWGDYLFTLEPNGSDRPQMAWLTSHLTGSVSSSAVVSSSSAAISSSSIVASSSSRQSSSSVTISSSAANVAPVATADAYTTQEDAPISTSAPGILSNDHDANGNAITAYLVTNVSHGTLALNSNGSFTYTPAANYSGSDAFTYKPYDGVAYGNTVTVSLTITNVNDAPTGNSDNYATAQNTTLSVAAADGLLKNDSDPENNSMTAVLVTNPSHGSLTLNSDGSFTYIPTTGFTGSDAFGYKPYDGTSYGTVATVTINVTAGSNTAPSAGNDSYTTYEDQAFQNYQWNSLLGNDTDPNGDVITTILGTTTTHGTLVLNTDGTFLYTPAANYSGSDVFTYKAFDGSLMSTEATVAITISAQNDNPIVVTPIANQVLDGGFTPYTIDLSSVFSDPDGDAISISMDGIWMANGSLTGTKLSLSPASGMSGTQTVTLRASDNKGGSAVSTFELTVGKTPETSSSSNGISSSSSSEPSKIIIHKPTVEMNWKIAVQHGSGVAVIRDLYGRSLAKISLPSSPETIRNAVSQKQVFLLQVGKHTYRLD